MFLCTMPIPPSWASGNRQARFRDRIHRRRHQRDVQPDLAGKLGPQSDIARQDVRMGGNEQDVVEG